VLGRIFTSFHSAAQALPQMHGSRGEQHDRISGRYGLHKITREPWRGPRPRMCVLATSGPRSDHASGSDAAKATGPVDPGRDKPPGVRGLITAVGWGSTPRRTYEPSATAPPPLPKALQGPRDRLERRVLRLAHLSACGSRRVCSRHKNSAPRGSDRRLRRPARGAARCP
jgi:hypothetical protein